MRDCLIVDFHLGRGVVEFENYSTYFNILCQKIPQVLNSFVHAQCVFTEEKSMTVDYLMGVTV